MEGKWNPLRLRVPKRSKQRQTKSCAVVVAIENKKADLVRAPKPHTEEAALRRPNPVNPSMCSSGAPLPLPISFLLWRQDYVTKHPTFQSLMLDPNILIPIWNNHVPYIEKQSWYNRGENLIQETTLMLWKTNFSRFAAGLSPDHLANIWNVSVCKLEKLQWKMKAESYLREAIVPFQIHLPSNIVFPEDEQIRLTTAHVHSQPQPRPQFLFQSESHLTSVIQMQGQGLALNSMEFSPMPMTRQAGIYTPVPVSGAFRLWTEFIKTSMTPESWTKRNFEQLWRNLSGREKSRWKAQAGQLQQQQEQQFQGLQYYQYQNEFYNSFDQYQHFVPEPMGHGQFIGTGSSGDHMSAFSANEYPPCVQMTMTAPAPNLSRPRHWSSDRKKTWKPIVKKMRKPQEGFQFKIDNSPGPFRPVLTTKPNSMDTEESSLSYVPRLIYSENEEGCQFEHPYIKEIHSWTPNEFQLRETWDEAVPTILDITESFSVISTQNGVLEMLEHLKTVPEIAVDVEHHSVRSFLGLTCLIQISTRSQDFILDGLALFRNLECLNIVFTDPNIIKVFHGAESDILWLQRDFGLYIVGMFDTCVASQHLDIYRQRSSLKHLIQRYVGIDIDKKFQMEDWRFRPLTPEMIHYARSDTHYLLYIFDQMKLDLLRSETPDLLPSVFQDSSLQCLAVYEKPRVDLCWELAHFGQSLNERQRLVLKELHAWRDSVARSKDESLDYVLSKESLKMLVRELPSRNQILGSESFKQCATRLVREHISVIDGIMRRGRVIVEPN